MKEIVKKGKSWIFNAIQIVLFIVLVYIDIKRCSGTGDEWAAANLNIWWILGALILMHYGLRKLKNWWVLVISVASVTMLGAIRILLWEKPNVPYIELFTVTINIWVLGIAGACFLISSINGIKKNKQNGEKSGKAILSFVWQNLGLLFFTGYLLIASFMPDDVHKPFVTLCIFGFLYLIPFSERQKKQMVRNLVWGIMLGFWLQQIHAFGFRPYTDAYLRYRGMYYNSNIYALLCLTVLVLTLCKLYTLKLEKGKNGILFVLMLVQYCFSFAFICFSIGRIAMFLAVVFTVMFLILLLWEYRHIEWRKVLLTVGLTITLMLMVFPATYLSIRYLPTILKHPVEFHDEYYMRGDLDNPDDYVSVREFLGKSLKRFEKLLVSYSSEKELENRVLNDKNKSPEEPEVLTPVDPDWENKEYYVDYEKGYNAFEIRIAIWRTFLANSGLTGVAPENRVQYISPYVAMIHAHNIFIQMIFQYGWISGLFFLGWIACYVFAAFRHLKEYKGTLYGILPLGVLCLVLGFGMVELAWQLGQISWFLLLFAYLFMIKKKEEIKKIS